MRLYPDDIFRSEKLSIDLASKSVRGGIATFTSQGFQLVLSLVGTAVLARLLTPVDYGLIGMVLIIVGFADMFKDAGLSMATVQKERISHDQISTLFWINVLISLCLGFVIFSLSPLVVRFYGRQELYKVTSVLSLSFIAGGLSIQHQALLRRHMYFTAIAYIQILSQVVNLFVTVMCALYGMRYWALVCGTLARGLVNALLSFAFCPWIPGKPKRGTGVREMLRFGSHLVGFNFANYFSRNSDNILIGKFLGATALGLYSRAYQLSLMQMAQLRVPIIQVALPVLSTLRSQPDRFAKYYKHIILILSSLAIPITVYCAIEAGFIIRLLLGSQWISAVSVFRVLATAGLLETIAGTQGLVLVSLGFTYRYFKWGLFNTIITIASFVAGLPFGIEGVATAYATISCVILVPSLFYCFHDTPITVPLFLKTLVRPLVTSSIAAACTLLSKALWNSDTYTVHFFHGLVFITIYSVLTLCQRSFRETAGFLINCFMTARRMGTNGISNS